MKKMLLLALSLISLSACTRVGTGELGIVLDFNRQVMPNPVVNAWEFHILDSLYVVDSTQVRVAVTNVKAKDIDGILFQDIDAQITYNINPQGAINFYSKTKEIDWNEESRENTLGLRLISKEARNALIKTFTQYKALQVNTEKAEMEAKLKDTLTAQLEALYPDTFIVTDVNIDSAQLDENVEKVLQAQALIDSEKRTIQSRMELQAKQSALLDQELSEIKATAAKVGIPVSELLRYKNDKERNRVLSEMARNGSKNTQIQLKD